jgi:ATP-dependent DNA helicase RecG
MKTFICRVYFFHKDFLLELIIGKNEIFTENSNKPHGYGKINPNNFSPYPKNPLIAKVFKEMGLVDELGSGVRNIYKYCKIYFSSGPSLL